MARLHYDVGKRYVFNLADPDQTIITGVFHSELQIAGVKMMWFDHAEPPGSPWIYRAEDNTMLLFNRDAPNFSAEHDRILNVNPDVHVALREHPRSVEGLEEEAGISGHNDSHRLKAAREAQLWLTKPPEAEGKRAKRENIRRFPPEVAGHIASFIQPHEPGSRLVETTDEHNEPKYGPSPMGGRRRTKRRIRRTKRTRFRR